MKAALEEKQSPPFGRRRDPENPSPFGKVNNSDATSSVLQDLRSLLTARFPGSRTLCGEPGGAKKGNSEGGAGRREDLYGAAHGLSSPLSLGRRVLPTGIKKWDTAAGGLRMGEVTEVCGPLGGTGLVMDQLLEATMHAGWLGAWVDAGDALEVEAWDARALQRVVWVRCKNPMMALKGADLLLRDGNLSWVTLDLQAVSPVALRRISAQHWHRFHRLVENIGNALIVLTPAPMVEGAKVRVVGRQRWTLDSIHLPRRELRATCDMEVFVRGRQLGTVSGQHGPEQPTGKEASAFLRMTA
jgi:hypothetical protein